MLIEAGGKDWNPLIHIPAGFMKMLDHKTLTWGFYAERDPGTNGRSILYPRGRVIGGSSSINGLIYIRGQPEDYDHWQQLGNRGWGWDDVPALFQEGRTLGRRGERGARQGRAALHLEDEPPGDRRGGDRGRRGDGLEYREDVNDLTRLHKDCIGWCQQTRGGRFRASTARTYLRPALKRATFSS